MANYDAIVVGSGPNGLAAAITFARAGCSVLVIEAENHFGGGARSAELTLPGFTHDLCSAVYPLAVSSPFFRRLPLEAHGLTWVFPPASLAHPLDDGTAMVATPSAQGMQSVDLGNDAAAYHRLVGKLSVHADALMAELLAPLHWPSHPWLAAHFGRYGMRSCAGIVKRWFREDRARALFAGFAAHSMLPLSYLGTGAFGLILALTAHATGWPIPLGGAQKLTDALVSYLRSLGGTVVKNAPVDSLDALPSSRVFLCDVSPRELVRIAGKRLPAKYVAKLMRYRYGMAAFKMDWALNAPIPWRARECALAGTVHLGGSFDEISVSESSAWQGLPATRPFVLLAQPSLFDVTRAPKRNETAWAYCHVPNGSANNVSQHIEAQIERFAPGFRDVVIERSVRLPRDLESSNRNLVGGDINGGVGDIRQLFLRPTRRTYATPAKGIYLCSASTPPGGGVHGMCGYYAARRALKEVMRQSRSFS